MIVKVKPDMIRLKPLDGTLTCNEQVFACGISPHTYLWQGEVFGAGRAHGDREYQVLGKNQYGLSPARYRKLFHKETRSCLTLRDDKCLHSISMNAIRAVNTSEYNIGDIDSDAALHEGIQHVLDEAGYIVENHGLENFFVEALEICVDVDIPFYKLATPLENFRYPGTRGDNMRFPGHTLVMGTGKKAKMRMKLYDKGWESKRQPLICNGERIGRGQFTRVEFLLVKDKITDLFGGNTFKHLTLAKMQDVFWDLVEPMYSIAVKCPDTLGTSVIENLARSLYYESLIFPGESVLEPVSSAYIRQTKSASYARKVLREAQAIADSIRGESLRDLLHPNAPAPKIMDIRV